MNMSPYKILSAYFMESGTTPDMSAHNLSTQMTDMIVNQFKHATHDGNHLTADNMSGIAGQILISDPNSERMVNLPNGMQNKRMRFVLRVGIPGQVNGIVFYYEGYTDYNGWNTNVKDFDPNMRLYINSIQQVSNAQRMTAQGMEPFVQVVQCTHLIHPNNIGVGQMGWNATFDPMGMNLQNQPSALRPFDLMNALATNAHTLMNGGQPVIDSRPSIDLLLVNRENTVASNYMANAVHGLAMGMYSANDSAATSNPATAYEAAAGKTTELNPFTDRFLNPMINELGLQQNGFVSWGQLSQLHPELHVQGVTTVNSKHAGSRDDIFVSDHNNFQSTIGDRRLGTLINERVMSSLPGLMLSSLLVYARVHITNMTPDGSLACVVTDPISFVDIPPGYLMNRIPFLQEKFKSLIFQDIGLPQHVPIDAFFTVDAFGESFSNISVNCEPHVPYPTASYSDSTASQLVASQGMVLPTMANDINYLVTATC